MALSGHSAALRASAQVLRSFLPSNPRRATYLRAKGGGSMALSQNIEMVSIGV